MNKRIRRKVAKRRHELTAFVDVLGVAASRFADAMAGVFKSLAETLSSMSSRCPGMTDCQTHPEYHALLAAVCAAPGDDLPRLVLADWLEEHGQWERAVWIREQITDGNTGRYSGSAPMVREFRPHAGVPGDWPGVTLVICRGFVSEVHCTLADWCGGICGWCILGREMGCMSDGSLSRECIFCSGTGRTSRGPIGPRLVREHPVERVVLTDREPIYNEERTFYRWWRGRHHEANYGMPEQVFDFLPTGPAMRVRPTHYDYMNRLTAVSAMSAAIIAWAKATTPP